MKTTRLNRIRVALRGLGLGVAIGALALTSALAQVPSTSPPYNTDIGAVVTNALRTAGTFNSASQNNLDKLGAVCVLNVTTESGSPSVTFAIQNFDAASSTWQTIVVSGSLTTTLGVTPTTIFARVGAQTSSFATGISAGQGVPLGRIWRVQQVVAGSNTPAITGTIGCNLVK